jgi:penicillin-binding protein 1A
VPPPDDDVELLAFRHRLRRQTRKRKRWVGLLVALAVVVPLVTAALVAGGVYGAAKYVESDCSLGSLRPLQLGANSFVFASDGSVLGSIPSSTNRQPLSLRQIANAVPQATVAIEDRRFWQHGAVDWIGVVRAAWKDVTSGQLLQGGSTITQQLARNLYIPNANDKFHRKIEETCLAVKLEQKLTKRQVLDAYLNTVYYGNHAFGIEAAAQTYFSRHASQLTLPQAALISGLPQAPSVYDPLVDPQAALRRRNDVLAAMLDAGNITAAQERRAVASPLGLRPTDIYTKIRLPYVFGYVESQLIAHYGAERVRAGGLRVTTTINPRLQALAEQAQHDVLKTRGDPASALVAIDPATGDVRAMAVDVPDGRHLEFNLASQGHRTAGSSFKPFVLATAMEQGVSPYATFSGPPELSIPDQRCYTNNQPWDVHNFADESAGTMDLLDATAHSVNTIFAQLVTRVGPDQVVATAHRMGITSKLLPVCSITLGTQPVSPLEMADAYATFAARGVHRAAQALETVRFPNGQVDRPRARATQAIGQNAADLVTYALEGVVKFGTGTAAALADRPAAGKTGTAENFQDAWFCGFVPQLVACVWVGYPRAEIPLQNVEGIAGVVGGTLPAQIWHEFMTGAVSSLPVMDFVQPDFSTQTVYPEGSFPPPPPAPPPGPPVVAPPQNGPGHGPHHGPNGHGHGQGQVGPGNN